MAAIRGSLRTSERCRDASVGVKDHSATLRVSLPEATVANDVRSYDGGIIAHPQRLVRPTSVAEIQAVLKDRTTYPGPVRAMGSYHSLTPCASSDGTIIDMKGMTRVLDIDMRNMTFTAEAGLQFIDANHALRANNLQFHTNIEIGNMTLGSAATCHTKDALDGIEFGQVGSYVSAMKYVTPAGDLAEATDADPDLMSKLRASYGLAGVVYEVTFRVKPIEVAHFNYMPRPLQDLTDAEVNDIIDRSQGLVCWTVGNTCVFQQRRATEGPAGVLGSLLADKRQRLWNHGGAAIGRFLDTFAPEGDLRNLLHDTWVATQKGIYGALAKGGGFSLQAPDKTIDYRQTPDSARYAFTFWAFPRAQWLKTLKEYAAFADDHFARTGFRCNLPLGSYYIRKDQHSLLSYTYDGDAFSIDPIHAPTDREAWNTFLRAFNDFAAKRNGIPLLNQSPFVTREQVEAAYGARWRQFSTWVRSVDPDGRLLNPFFAELLSPE
jgi:hypothetical protein